MVKSHAPASAVLAAAMSEEDLLVNITSGTRRRPGLCALYGLKWYHTRTSKHSPAGFPDLVIAGLGGVAYYELKIQGENPTRAQQEWLDLLAASGQRAGVRRPEDWYSGRIARELAVIARIAGAA